MAQCPPGSNLVILASSIAISLAADLSADDTNTLSSFFNAIGDNLGIIAAEKASSD